MHVGFASIVCVGVLLSAANGCSEVTTAGSSECTSGVSLRQGSFDVTKSKFAFGGSKPVLEDSNGQMRWVGSHGEVVVKANGAALGIINADAPESNLPAWSTDSDELAAHTAEYFIAMGVETCQIRGQSVFGSGTCTGASGGSSESCQALPSTGVLGRGVDGISIVESTATATFVRGDITTSEALYWPEIPAVVVSDALALRERIRDPSKLAEYKKLLPDNAQGQGEILIHHSGPYETKFRAVAVYEVNLTPPSDQDPDSYYEVRDFDAQATAVEGWN